MAKLNPDVPDVVGTFRESRSISQPSFESAAGLELRSAGQVVGEAATLNQTAAELYAENSVRPQAEAIRDQEEKRLEGLKASGTEDTGTNVVGSTPGQQPPSDVKQGIQTAQKLQNARNDGKAGRSDYLGKMQALQVSLRAQHPGWIPYIDQEISKVTGGDPANLRIAQLQRDISQGASEEKARRRSVEARFMAGEGGPEGDAKFRDYQTGKLSTPDAEAFLVHQAGIDKGLARAALAHQYQTNTDADKSNLAESAATNYAVGSANNGYNADLAAAGIKTFNMTQEQSADFAQRLAKGEINLSSEEANHLADAFDQRLKIREAAIRAKLQEPDSPDGSSPWTRIKDPAAREKVIDTSMGMYKIFSDRMRNKDFGYVGEKQRQLDASATDYEKQFMTDPKNQDVAAQVRAARVLGKGTPELAKIIQNESVLAGVDQRVQGMIHTDAERMAAQTDTDGRTTIAKLIAGKKDLPVSEATRAKAIDADIKIGPKLLMNPKVDDATKVNVLHGMFDQANKGVTLNFDLEGTGKAVDSRGNALPGRVYAFQQMTQPAMTDEVRRLSQNDPNLWKEYKDWVNTEFGQHVFNREILDMASIQKHPDTAISWNPVAHQFSLDIGPDKNVNLRDTRTNTFGDTQRYASSYNQVELEHAKRVVNNINAGLKNLSYVAEKDGTNVDAYLVRQLMGMGYDPRTSNGEIFPEAFLESLKPPKKPNANPKQ